MLHLRESLRLTMYTQSLQLAMQKAEHCGLSSCFMFRACSFFSQYFTPIVSNCSCRSEAQPSFSILCTVVQEANLHCEDSTGACHGAWAGISARSLIWGII